MIEFPGFEPEKKDRVTPDPKDSTGYKGEMETPPPILILRDPRPARQSASPKSIPYSNPPEKSAARDMSLPFPDIKHISSSTSVRTDIPPDKHVTPAHNAPRGSSSLSMTFPDITLHKSTPPQTEKQPVRLKNVSELSMDFASLNLQMISTEPVRGEGRSLPVVSDPATADEERFSVRIEGLTHVEDVPAEDAVETIEWKIEQPQTIEEEAGASDKLMMRSEPEEPAPAPQNRRIVPMEPADEAIANGRVVEPPLEEGESVPLLFIAGEEAAALGISDSEDIVLDVSSYQEPPAPERSDDDEPARVPHGEEPAVFEPPVPSRESGETHLEIFSSDDMTPQEPQPDFAKPEEIEPYDGESALFSPPAKGLTTPPGTPPHPKESRPADSPEVKHLYKAALAYAERILYNDEGLTPALISQFKRLIGRLIELVKEDNEQVFQLLFNYMPQGTDPLYVNMVNVCILSLEMGIGLRYDDDQLMDLGLAAFLHDIGMKGFVDLVSESRELKPREMARIREHSEMAPAMLSSVQHILHEPVIQAIGQEHERMDGSGYPTGNTNGKINEYAKIIGITDVFEALTHDRPHRERHSALDAIKTMMKNKALFEPRLVKAFLERIGFYPRGTFVELNTHEVAQVVKQNSGMPLSPIVRLLYNNNGEEVPHPRLLDLGEGTKIFIQNSLGSAA